MSSRIGSSAAFAVLALAAGLALSASGSAPPVVQPAGQSPGQPPVGPEGLRALDGEWIFVEDRTPDQPLDRLGPPMASKFSMRVEEGVVILNGHGSGHRDVRVALDGSITTVAEPNGRPVRYHGGWSEGGFQYEVEFERDPGQSGFRTIRRSFQPTPEGLIVRVAIDPPSSEAVGLYRLAQDIPMPTPVAAAIGDVAWLAGDWTGTRSSGSSIEERWSPPLGGAMLAVARAVNAGGRMVGFEYLRIVERDGSLVYVAQPGGGAKTEFLLTELATTEQGGRRAVFDNPRHDYPKRIVYELSGDGGDATLTTTTGYMKGGTPRRGEYSRDAG